jgi:hypothetical protein
VLNNPAINHQGLVKIYSLKNRAAAALGLLFSLFLVCFLMTELSEFRLINRLLSVSSFHPTDRLTSVKLLFILIGIFSALLVLRISYFPNVVISENQMRIGWRFGGKFGLSYRHQIPWDQIAQIDSGGSRMIQWSSNTSIIYHTGKVPVGRSSDLGEAVISTGLGYRNYCKILNLAIQRAPQAAVDNLTLHLIKNCSKGN